MRETPESKEFVRNLRSLRTRLETEGMLSPTEIDTTVGFAALNTAVMNQGKQLAAMRQEIASIKAQHRSFKASLVKLARFVGENLKPKTSVTRKRSKNNSTYRRKR